MFTTNKTLGIIAGIRIIRCMVNTSRLTHFMSQQKVAHSLCSNTTLMKVKHYGNTNTIAVDSGRTTLSKYIWEFKDMDKNDLVMKWSILKKAHLCGTGLAASAGEGLHFYVKKTCITRRQICDADRSINTILLYVDDI